MLNDIYQALDPVAFTIGPFSVRWYGIAYVLGFVCAAIVVWRTARRWKIRVDADALCTIMLCVIIGIILGARLGYVVFYGDGYYWEHPAKILAINEGGMSFHGGLIGALLSGIVAAKLTGIPYLTLADLGCIAAPIGLFFGRIANFINGELWGSVTDLPWGVVFGGSAGDLPRHPSQLYEAFLEGIVIFVVLYALSRKRRRVPTGGSFQTGTGAALVDVRRSQPLPRGTFLGLFLIMYGVFRILIEFVREPDAQLGYLWGGWLTMGQVLSAPLVVVGVIVLVYAIKMKKPQQGLPGQPLDPEGHYYNRTMYQ